MASPVSDSFDWNGIYAEVQAKANVPSTAETIRDGSRLVVRDLLVSLDIVIDAVEKAATPPLVVYVFADVVTLPALRNWALPPLALFIVTRRIVATSGTFLQLDYRTNTEATIVLYANEIEGPLSVHAVTAASPSTPFIFDLTQFDPIGVQIRSSDGLADQISLPTLPDELLNIGDPLWMSLSTNFQFASMFVDPHPDVAREMLAWIQAASAPSPLLSDLCLQSAALQTQLTVSSSGVNFVPYLSPTVYRDTAAAFGKAAKDYETEYQYFSAQATTKEQWIASAKNMQQYFALTDDFNRELIAQAEANLQGASDAVDAAKLRFKLTQLTIGPLQAKFQAGIEIWKSDQVLKAVFDILSAVVTFGAAIGAMAVGDEAAAGTAAKSAAGAGKAAADAAKAGGDAAKVAGTMSQLAGAMKALQNISKALMATLAFVQKIVAASSAMKPGGRFDKPVPSVDDISAQAEWDVFRLRIDDMMQFPVDKGIEGARAYRMALDELSIYGKALAATQSSYVRTAQEVARLRLQSRVSSGMTKTIADSIARMEAGEKPDRLMMHMLYVRGLNMKRWLFIALRNYTWSYRYWALRTSAVHPSIIAPASKLIDDLATMQRDYSDALQSFQPPPQEFGTQEGGVVVEISDPAVLNALRTRGEAQIAVDPSLPQFAAYDRVRVSRLRVWLDGASGPTYIQIRTNGVYRDRLGTDAYTFTAAPLERFFQYHGRPGDVSGIDGDGVVADENRFAYFQPTPFTEWHLRIPPALNPNIDLSGLTKIAMTFTGSAIGRMGSRK
jgi:hypothetical protein